MSQHLGCCSEPSPPQSLDGVLVHKRPTPPPYKNVPLRSCLSLRSNESPDEHVVDEVGNRRFKAPHVQNPSDKNFTWGAFRFTLRTVLSKPKIGNLELEEPTREVEAFAWHRKSRVTGCKRTLVLQHSMEFRRASAATMLQLKAWTIEAKTFQTQAEHMSFHALCIPPEAFVEARIIKDRPTHPPTADNEQILTSAPSSSHPRQQQPPSVPSSPSLAALQGP